MTTADTSCGPTEVPQDVDIDAMRAKYAREREKRLRTDGGAQYLELDGDLADLYEVDPYTPVADRPPSRRTSRSRCSAAGSPGCCRVLI